MSSSSESDHDHGDGSRAEDPPSGEAEDDEEWEDLDEDDREMDQALVQSLYRAIDDAKKTGPAFSKKQMRVLRTILELKFPKKKVVEIPA